VETVIHATRNLCFDLMRDVSAHMKLVAHRAVVLKSTAERVAAPALAY
jgi:hypothetical protein